MQRRGVWLHRSLKVELRGSSGTGVLRPGLHSFMDRDQGSNTSTICKSQVLPQCRNPELRLYAC